MNQISKGQEVKAIVGAEPKMLAPIMPEELAGWFGASEEIESADIQLGKLKIAQFMSQVVTDEKVKAGEFYSTIDMSPIADPSVLIFHQTKTWIIKLNGEFDKIVPFDVKNSGWRYVEETPDGQIQRTLCRNYYVLIPGLVDYLVRPHVVVVSGSASHRAKKLNTLLLQLKGNKLPSCAYRFKLVAEKMSNEKGKWFEPDFSIARSATTEEMLACKRWADTLAAATVHVVEDSAPDYVTEDIPF